MRNALLFLAVLFAVPAQLEASQAIASDRAEPSALSVRFAAGLLSIEARNVSWPELLAELSRQTGTTLHINIPLQGTVTFSIIGLGLERALLRLFGPEADFMFVYREPPETKVVSSLLSDVWVFGRGGLGTRGPEPAHNHTVLSRTGSPEDELQTEFESNPQSAHGAALTSADVDVRFKAIAYLGQSADQQAVKSLLQLFHDPDPDVRRSAVEAVGRLAESDAQVRSALTDVMKKSRDVDTRQLAASYLGISLTDEK